MASPGKVVHYLAFVIAALFCAWPISIMVEESFSVDLGPLFSGQGIRFIGGVPYYSGGIYPTISNYIDAFSLAGFPRLVLNSTSIEFLNIAVVLVAGIPAAYALARLNMRGKNVVGFLLLALRTASPFAIVLPLFIIYVQVGLWDTYLGMSIAYLAVDAPVVVWMLRGYFSEVPREIYEAAEVSGASERQIFWRVAFPSVLPGIVATAIFAFIIIWNEFLLADLLTGGAARTVSVGIWTGAGEKVSAFKSVDWDTVNTFGTLAFVPAYIIIIAIRRYIARGFSLGIAK